MQALEQARILEIGRSGYLRGLFPQAAMRFDTSPHDNQSSGGVEGLLALSRAIASAQYDLIVCEPNFRSRWTALIRMLSSRRALQGNISLTRPMGLQLLRRQIATPIAVVDIEDGPTVSSCDHYLLDRCVLWFKRELPVDQWRIFGALPSGRFRMRRRYRGYVDKVRPMSLGLSPDMEALVADLPRAKETDVFFAASLSVHPARQRAMDELRGLARQGVRVDIPDGRLDRSEFYRRCAAARMVLSPEGFGWDCFRHYEAAACGSVPLMNYPSILRHRPFEHGRDCFFYAPETGGLTAVVLDALRDSQKLDAMGQAAREHALRFHRREAIGRYIVETALSQRAQTGAAGVRSTRLDG